jgi:hypothetical protein
MGALKKLIEIGVIHVKAKVEIAPLRLGQRTLAMTFQEFLLQRRAHGAVE